MRRVILIILLTIIFVLPGIASAQQGGTYIVQRGDTLYSLARRFGTTVEALAAANGIVNPNLIYAGQVLVIPGGAAPPAPAPTPGAPQPGYIIHTVQRGENLFRISLRYGTTVSAVAALNGIANPALIYAGQQLRIPTTGAPTVTPGAPTPVVTGTPGATTVPSPSPTTVGFAYGIQVHLPYQDMQAVADRVVELGLTWVKQQVAWEDFERSRGNIDWSTLDMMVDVLESRGLNILFSVVKAPDWARDTSTEDGPPTDYQDYVNFVSALASRYRGRVDAYEIWNEQNLRREWHTNAGLSAAHYMTLLRMSYEAIKAADPSAIVVSGGLAPTGVNDGVNAIDDRVYLRQMYENGLAAYSDAIGAHPNGWANPPDSTCCNSPAPTHNDHPSFYFLNTLRDYRAIMVQYGDSGTFIWATEFGWGSIEGLPVGGPLPGYEFVQYTSLNEQAQYITRAFELGRAEAYVGPMFLWNLNFCQAAGATSEQCYWSLLGPDGSPRPAYDALRAAPK